MKNFKMKNEGEKLQKIPEKFPCAESIIFLILSTTIEPEFENL